MARREQFWAIIAAMGGTWPISDGEWLLTVAPKAYELATGESFEHEFPVSYETGSNAAAWGTGPAGEPDTVTGPTEVVAQNTASQVLLPIAVVKDVRRGRISVTIHHEKRLPWRPVYMRYQKDYVNWINHAQDWTRWWAALPTAI